MLRLSVSCDGNVESLDSKPDVHCWQIFIYGNSPNRVVDNFSDVCSIASIFTYFVCEPETVPLFTLTYFTSFRPWSITRAF